MAFFERTSEQIITSSLSQLSQYSNITRLSPGAKARLLLDITSKEQGSQHQTFDEGLLQAFIKYADSRFLGFFGDMLNLPIKEAQHAYDTTNNFMFYVSSGSFGDINSGSDFTIPSGTIVSTVPSDGTIITPGIEEQPVIRYITTEDVVCYSGQSFVYVPIRAQIEGTFYNIPRNVLLQHNYTGYTLSSTNRLKCINQYSISNGEERESPESYRFRLQNIFKARQLAVPVAIRLAALSVPGVSNIKEVICEQGPGTYSIYILSTTPTTSAQLLTEVANVVGQVTGMGNRPFILAPVPLGIEVIAAINWSVKATPNDISRGYINMRNALEARLNRTDIGEEITFDELRDLLVNTSQYALSIGMDVPNQFEEKYIYKQDPITGGVTRNLVTGKKITPLYNERIILETSGTDHGIRFITRQE